ncbi:MAG: uL15 family ribosomal protein [Patescibacteria group bacterium UBA2163]
MQKHSLTRPVNLDSKKRIGRGGKRGKTSGKGHKGQKARAGNSTRPEMRDIIKKIPKLRGHGKNRAKTVVPRVAYQVVNLDQLETHFDTGAKVTPSALLEAGLVRRQGGKLPKVKVLARGTLSKKLSFEKVNASKEARTHIEKAGGTIAA